MEPSACEPMWETALSLDKSDSVCLESLSVRESCLMLDLKEAKERSSPLPKIFLGVRGLFAGESTLGVVALAQESRCSYLILARALASANVVGVFSFEAAGVFLKVSKVLSIEMAGFFSRDLKNRSSDHPGYKFFKNLRSFCDLPLLERPIVQYFAAGSLSPKSGSDFSFL